MATRGKDYDKRYAYLYKKLQKENPDLSAKQIEDRIKGIQIKDPELTSTVGSDETRDLYNRDNKHDNRSKGSYFSDDQIKNAKTPQEAYDMKFWNTKNMFNLSNEETQQRLSKSSTPAENTTVNTPGGGYSTQQVPGLSKGISGVTKNNKSLYNPSSTTEKTPEQQEAEKYYGSMSKAPITPTAPTKTQKTTKKTTKKAQPKRESLTPIEAKKVTGLDSSGNLLSSDEVKAERDSRKERGTSLLENGETIAEWNRSLGMTEDGEEMTEAQKTQGGLNFDFYKMNDADRKKALAKHQELTGKYKGKLTPEVSQSLFNGAVNSLLPGGNSNNPDANTGAGNAGAGNAGAGNTNAGTGNEEISDYDKSLNEATRMGQGLELAKFGTNLARLGRNKNVKPPEDIIPTRTPLLNYEAVNADYNPINEDINRGLSQMRSMGLGSSHINSLLRSGISAKNKLASSINETNRQGRAQTNAANSNIIARDNDNLYKAKWQDRMMDQKLADSLSESNRGLYNSMFDNATNMYNYKVNALNSKLKKKQYDDYLLMEEARRVTGGE